MLSTIFAQDIDIDPTGSVGTVVGGWNVSRILSALIGVILVVAALIFFFMLVIAGIKWVSSGGDKAQTESARNQITAALVGLIIVFSAWAIAALLENFFGFSILNFDLPTI